MSPCFCFLASPACFSLSLAACTSHLGDEWEESEPPAEEVIQAEEVVEEGVVEFDGLSLRLGFDGHRKLEPGQYFTPKWILHNAADSSRRYVQPGDGSAVGWREPHVYYTAQRQLADGQWVDVETGDLGRCGLYDHDWHDEIATLDAGASVELEWLPSPAWQLQLQQAGRVRLFAHYEFSAGAGFETGRGASEDLAEMAGVPAFHLISAPLELEIVRPLDLQLVPKPATGSVRRLSDLFALRLSNVGKAGRTLPRPNWMNVRARVRKDGEIIASLHDPDWESRKEESSFRLSAGQSVGVARKRGRLRATRGAPRSRRRNQRDLRSRELRGRSPRDRLGPRRSPLIGRVSEHRRTRIPLVGVRCFRLWRVLELLHAPSGSSPGSPPSAIRLRRE